MIILCIKKLQENGKKRKTKKNINFEQLKLNVGKIFKV